MRGTHTDGLAWIHSRRWRYHGDHGAELVLLSSPSFAVCLSHCSSPLTRQNTDFSDGQTGEHAHMRPTKLWLCIREFYVEQITIVSYDWFQLRPIAQRQLPLAPWTAQETKQGKNTSSTAHAWLVQRILLFRLIPRSHQAVIGLLSEVIIFWFDWMLDVSESLVRVNVIVTGHKPTHTHMRCRTHNVRISKEANTYNYK